MSDRTGDWRMEFNDITDIHREARKRNFLTDIQFIVGKGALSKKFSAHKIFLACGSPVFEKMFFGKMPEERNPIALEDDDPESFEMLLNYIYGERNAIKSFPLSWKFYVIGDKYLLPSIKEEFENYVCNTTMHLEDFWEVLRSNVGMKSTHFLIKLNKYVEMNTVRVVKSKEFQDLTLDYVQHFLSFETLNIDEYELLVSVTQWTFNRFASETTWIDLLQVVKYIHFSRLSADEFCYFLQSYPNAFSAEDSFQILKHLQDRSLYNLPEWCLKKNS